MSALPPAAVRVMLVEPEGLVRTRFAAAICADARLLLASCLAAGRAALGRLAEVRPDVLLAGLALRDFDVVELVRVARRVSCEVLVIAAPGEEADAVRSLAAGAAGCVPRLCGGRDVRRIGGYVLQQAAAGLEGGRTTGIGRVGTCPDRQDRQAGKEGQG